MPLEPFSVNIRVKLAFLWTTILALYIYADYFNLMTPGSINEMIDLNSPVGPITPVLLVIFATLLIIPTLMIPGSLLLPPKASKWTSILFAIIYGAISIMIIISSFSESWMTFYIIYQFVELFIFGLIIWYALKWPGIRPDIKSL